jgi:hypothetical protein
VLYDHLIETHVFLSLVHRARVHGLTESAMWWVADGE